MMLSTSPLDTTLKVYIAQDGVLAELLLKMNVSSITFSAMLFDSPALYADLGCTVRLWRGTMT